MHLSILNFSILTSSPRQTLLTSHLASRQTEQHHYHLPCSCKEILTITAEFTLKKNYVDTGLNIFQAVFKTLDNHVTDAYKAVPTSVPNTIG